MGQKTKPIPTLEMNGLHYRFFRDDIFYSVIDWCKTSGVWKIQGFRVLGFRNSIKVCGPF